MENRIHGEYWDMEDYSGIVLLGEAGCGKSEAAINLAIRLSKKRAVDLFDLDQTKVLFRTRDAAKRLERYPIRVRYEEQFYDVPNAVGGVDESIASTDRVTILDIGGDDIGAKLIGSYAPLLNRGNIKVLYLVNAYRPWSQTIEAVDGTLSAILAACRVRRVSFAANPYLGREMTAEEYERGLDKTIGMLQPYASIEGACVPERLAGQADLRALPCLPIHQYLHYQWEEEKEG